MLFALFSCQTPEKPSVDDIEAYITPESPTSQDALQLEFSTSNDIDSDDITVQWFRNDIPFTNVNTVLDSSNTERGDEWYAYIQFRKNDVEIQATSNTVTVLNSPPNPPVVTLEPLNPISGIDDLICSAHAVDPDDDFLSYLFQWTRDGEDFNTSEAIVPAAVIDSADWQCLVTVTDDQESSTAGSNIVNVVEPEPLEGPLVLNGGFEVGDFSGWTVEGACEVIDILDYIQPANGEWFAFGGEQDHCTISQSINLNAYGYDNTSIDAGLYRVELSSILANFDMADIFDDQVSAIVIFDDGFGNELGRIETLIAGDGQWTLREAKRLIPPETRTLLLRIEGKLRMDNINHSHIDDVLLEVTEASVFTPIFTKHPMLQDYRMDAMTIVWETDSADHIPYVEWGQNGSLNNQHTSIRSIWVTDAHVVHIAELTGLDIDTNYDYRVCGGDYCTDPATFKTAPSTDAPVRLAWMADNQEGDHRFRTHLEHLSLLEPDLLFVAGDLLQYGDELEEWDTKWWSPLQTNKFAQSTPTMIARGNHDREHPFAYAYTHMPENGAWYRFQYGSVFVVVLNTHAPVNNQEPPRDQSVYLTQALSSPQAQAADFRVVTFHQAPYSNATQHNTTGCEACRQWWVPIFEEYGVDLVISGHFHSYQRGEQNGVTYVIVAGGGSALLIDTFDNWSFMTVQQTWMYSVMDVVDGQLTWETYNLEDELIDAFQLTAR